MSDDQPTDPPPPTCTCGGVLREQACEEDCGERDVPKNDDERDNVL